MAAKRGNVKQPAAGARRDRLLYRVAVLVPCYNDLRAIAKVVADFPAALPEASVYVYDNNSTDGIIATAKVAGAIVRRETYQAGRSW